MTTARAILRLLRWDKPAGRLILLIPALWGVFAAAHGAPSPWLVAVMVVGTIATSAAGCVINDLWDRDIDPLVERTRTRPLASRELTIPVAVVTALVALVCAWGLTFFLNPFTFWLCLAAVPVIALYPAAKRVFPVPQLVLSIAWGFAVLISWSAVTASLSAAAWWLWGATIFYTLGFDTAYGLTDREDDRKIGVKSSAIFFGPLVSEAIAVFFALAFVCLVVAGYQLELGTGFYATLAIAAVLWWREYRLLKTTGDPARAGGRVFNENVTIGFLLLAGLIGGTLI
ncbi:4-hydroxybenzoate solanesyltransferase [Gloeobacter kilaueensis]|uniref:4-hydroxybenzoate solanesyltransferase n=1 Tax=Gloeobacter kilaueensis (strain ATCC BAA-2537 / CCAP 1431/1 / ULC 316 / JS1) TaxID=1183438 RepID=U5QG89_GLOK1|nr:4-hydroxybenzoate solanesyltransferase [Gloeobacter kilaueensis]AGY56690.1 4-hydroxybenzoate polyprenyltransferase [Gloeobacter kilaueensis JS1]